MDSAVELLNLILAKTQPHETIKMPVREAMLIATLGERELGQDLSLAILEMGVVRALETHGFFSRKVIIVPDEPPLPEDGKIDGGQ